MKIDRLRPQIVVCILGLLVGCSRSSTTSQTPAALSTAAPDKQATQQYWEKLGKTVRAAEKSFELLEKEPTVTNMSDSLRKASQLVELLGHTATVLNEMADWATEVKDYSEYANSFAAGLDAFIHGFVGDPLTPIRKSDNAQASIELRRQSLASRLSQLEQKGDQLDAAESIAWSSSSKAGPLSRRIRAHRVLDLPWVPAAGR